MGMARRRLLLVLRSLLVLLALLALASPARRMKSRDQSVIFLLDHSRSQGRDGLKSVYEIAGTLQDRLRVRPAAGYVAMGEEARLLRNPGDSRSLPSPEQASGIMDAIGASSNFERGVAFARGLFPAG